MPLKLAARSVHENTIFGNPFIVTIDGPAASGKSSVSRELARRLGWSWVSTGAFYRGLAYVAARLGAEMSDEEAIADLAHSPLWKVQMTAEETRVLMMTSGKLDNAPMTDVTAEIGREENGLVASRVSSFGKVRTALLDAQRNCAEGVIGLIAEGRDCGTVVFPNAHVKVFLTARAEDRAARRALEEGRDLDRTISEQKHRDAQDAGRKVAPMQASVDSMTIDTTTLNLDEVVDQVEDLVRQRLSSLSN